MKVKKKLKFTIILVKREISNKGQKITFRFMVKEVQAVLFQIIQEQEKVKTMQLFIQQVKTNQLL